MKELIQVCFRGILGIIALFALGDVLRNTSEQMVTYGLQIVSVLILLWVLEATIKYFNKWV